MNNSCKFCGDMVRNPQSNICEYCHYLKIGHEAIYTPKKKSVLNSGMTITILAALITITIILAIAPAR